MGLALVIDADIEDYSVTNGKYDGFKVFWRKIITLDYFFKPGLIFGKQVLIHTSEEFPDVADRGFVLGPGSET